MNITLHIDKSEEVQKEIEKVLKQLVAGIVTKDWIQGIVEDVVKNKLTTMIYGINTDWEETVRKAVVEILRSREIVTSQTLDAVIRQYLYEMLRKKMADAV